MIADKLTRLLVLGSALSVVACGGEGLTLPPEGAPAHITVLHGDGQSGRPDSTLADSLVVQVTDTRDRPVADATVNFTFPEADAQAAPATATTNADGIAWSKVTLGSQVGEANGVAEVPVDAGVTPVRAEFTATILPGDANGITLVSGDAQSGPVNSVLPLPLVVKVTDASGNPISGMSIAWTAEGGGSVSDQTSITGADGQASTTRTLGPTAGQQVTLASAPGLAGTPVTFTHTATAGTAAGVNKFSGDNQSALAGTELAAPLVVQVLDGAQNPIANAAVTWIVTGGGGTVSSENTNTDAQGFASVTWTLGPVAGANTLNAVVSGVGSATFNATGTAGTPSAGNSSVSASPTSITAGTGSSTVTVTVRDAGNNPVAGVSVSIASSGSGNSINPASATTGSNGVATFTFSSTVAESKTITATAGGVAITDQATVTVNKASSTVEITSDEEDPSTAGQSVTVEFTVTGSGGTPTGDVVVTISNGLPTETCTGTLSGGSGSCVLPVTLPGTGSGNRRVITATYGGDARFSGDTDTENHRVDPLPTANNPPTADFAAPSNCTAGQACQFNDGSSDSDGNVVGWTWNFGDGSATSDDQNPPHVFDVAGTYNVTLTVRDDDGATDDVTKPVTVTAANQAPVAVDDAYTTPGAGQGFSEPAPGVLGNDNGTDGPTLSAQNASDPAQGSVSMNSDGSFTYTPDLGATGTDSFTYEATDGSLTSQATVTITIAP